MKRILLLTLSFGLLFSLPLAGASPPDSKAKPAAEKKNETVSASDKSLQSFAKKEAETLTASQRTKLLDLLNKGQPHELEELDGVGEKRAKNIIAKRPLASVEDVIMVDGIGEGTFKKLIVWAKGNQESKVEKKETKPKAAPKPAKTR